MAKKKQYYVVVHGRRPGIYTRWAGDGGAADQVKGFTGAIYRGFYTRDEAMEWLGRFSKEKLSNLAPNLLKLVESSPVSELPSGPEDPLAAGTILISTDGGALENPGPGGYGVVLRSQGQSKELSGGYRRTTNNRMELMACIEGLKALDSPSSVIICSDSRYVVDGMRKGWAERWRAQGWRLGTAQSVKNADLWRKLLGLASIHHVEFRWVRGHAGNPDNERCDRLAMAAMRRSDLPPDVAYETAHPRPTLFPDGL